eukprot:CAMPEP_0174925806 /NCGR_PEP_ID=MMETSP1355-20121228/8151_1 /TAXON_ID=464990 /ORGANISM="Hemiselmis tepida, Strain CCMP443" /LENGTH=106 /DNA_ID=CAMNT_0016171763 /DNA_START=265 /DNA_END=584 /DNA_ORIENTATION=-
MTASETPLVVGVVLLVGLVVADTVAVEGAAARAPLVARGGAPRGGEVQGLGGSLHELDGAADGSELGAADEAWGEGRVSSALGLAGTSQEAGRSTAKNARAPHAAA